MTTLSTVLNGAAVLSTNTAPSMGTINVYNASGGSLAVTLPALAGLNVGACCVVAKYTQDLTYNTVTFTANGTDTFDDAVITSQVLWQPGQFYELQVISPAGTKLWKVIAGWQQPTGLAAIASEFSLTNSATTTAVISTTLPAATLAAGSTYRVTLNGTIQTQATSGTLTFTPLLQNTALAQTAVVASTTSANAASAFFLNYDISVRSTGTSGAAIAKPYGIANLATTGVVYLNSTSTSTTTVNTTVSAASRVLAVQAQWATASATNSLLVETATIERVI